MRRILSRLAVLTVIGAMGVMPTMSFGQGRRGGGGGGGGGRAPTPPVNSAVTQDQKDVTAAEADYNKANLALKDLVSKLHATLEQTDDWKNAQDALTKAKADLDTASKAVLAKLTKSNPDYVNAVAAAESADSALAVAKKSGDATPETLTPLANAKTDAHKNVDKMEKKALDADAAVKAATDKVKAAQAVIDQLNAQFQSSLASNTDYQTAKQAADDAQKKLTDARAKLTADRTPAARGAGARGGRGGGAGGGAPGGGGAGGGGVGSGRGGPPGPNGPPGAGGDNPPPPNNN